MLDFFNQLMVSLPAAGGLSELWNTVLKDWIGPVFFAAVAVFAIVFIKDRAWMKLIGFVGIAAIVGVLVFAGEDLFGSDGSLKSVAEGLSEQVGSN